MPINVPKNLPSIELLAREEHIFILDAHRAATQDIRPLQIAILNLMPLKIATETDLLRLLSNSPLQVDITLIRLDSHIPKTTPYQHLLEFYTSFAEICERDRKFDGLIVTGAPVEEMAFEEVRYWAELRQIITWAETHVTSTLFICWAAQAALYTKYGVQKYPLSRKLFGVFEMEPVAPARGNGLLRGFDDVFYAPHSRHTGIRRADLAHLLKDGTIEVVCQGVQSSNSNKEKKGDTDKTDVNKQTNGIHDITTTASTHSNTGSSSDDGGDDTDDSVGIHMMVGRGGRDVYVTGHAEYSPLTLDGEYRRDLAKGRSDIPVPLNYYKNDNPEEGVVVRWRGHGNLMYTNWLNYCVYQVMTADVADIH